MSGKKDILDRFEVDRDDTLIRFRCKGCDWDICVVALHDECSRMMREHIKECGKNYTKCVECKKKVPLGEKTHHCLECLDWKMDDLNR